jgi:pimeloyl-ACP methyl ester carboxylesterase
MGAGEPLLVIHSELNVPGWRRAWSDLSRWYEVIVPSLPGYGGSQRPEWVMYLSDLSAWVTWFVREAKIEEPVNVMGFSMGGWIAAEIATMNSSIFKKMTLVGAMGVLPQKGEIWDYFLNPTREAFVRSFHAPSKVEEFEEHYGRGWTEEKAAQAEIDREMTCRVAWKPYMYHPTLPHRLQNVSTPTLLIWGRDDRIAPVECCEIYRQSVKGARVKIFDECGHMPEVEKRGEFVEAVREFLG